MASNMTNTNIKWLFLIWNRVCENCNFVYQCQPIATHSRKICRVGVLGLCLINVALYSFSAEVKMPSGNIDKPVIEDNHDGTVSIKYEPREEGLHEIYVKFNGEHVQGKLIHSSRELTAITQSSGAIDHMAASKNNALRFLMHVRSVRSWNREAIWKFIFRVMNLASANLR